MLIASLIEKGRFCIPSFLFERKFYIHCEVGKPNGSSLTIQFIDDETEKLVHELQLPQQHIHSIILESIGAALDALGVGAAGENSYIKMAKELAKLKRKDYTYERKFDSGAYVNEEDPLDRPVEVREQPQLRPVGAVDQPLGGYAAWQEIARGEAAEWYLAGDGIVANVRAPAQEGQPLPDGGAGGALRNPVAYVAEAFDFHPPANEAALPAGWDQPRRRD